MSKDRKELEAEFHDQREEDRKNLNKNDFERKYPNKTFYSIVRVSRKYWKGWLRENSKGKRVLDYCCGLGNTSAELGSYGAKVDAIDISSEEIETARATAKAQGVEANITFHVMDAEHTEFPDNTFDIIVCCGVLHHLDLDAAYKELARVVKPDGCVLAIEALSHNPIIHWYRKSTPQQRTAWEVDHILTVPKIEKSRRYFSEIDIRFFHLFSIAAIPFRKFFFFKPLLTVLDFMDAIVLRIPWIRRMAWQGIFFLKGKKS
jgi:ubiquinone/menaquinone biosynthesis C-methylase UbiE